MANAQGKAKMTANGQEYTLHVGMSVLADIQEKHGLDALDRLEPPEGASKSWVPDLKVVGDLFLAALQRHHADVADRWLVDDLMAENTDGLESLMGGTFPDAKKNTVGKKKKPDKAG